MNRKRTSILCYTYDICLVNSVGVRSQASPPILRNVINFHDRDSALYLLYTEPRATYCAGAKQQEEILTNYCVDITACPPARASALQKVAFSIG